ncbi:MAG: tetratricopeptide repeat protein [Verrucomicrobiota bacterium]|jgi:tetratricopeptide (TPR) repeat protein
MRPSISARDRIKAAPGGKWRRWCFRLAAAIAVPAALIVLLELGLRLLEVGYPTTFLLDSENHGQDTYVQNNQFTWRFFGPRLGRRPYPLCILRKKAPDTVRIIVFGESAAFGDPQPEFGLPRMLQALLALRHPGARFEVVNTAITAINSHVIRDIARDCEQADGDVWVVYMGNNEVVGPCGAGTVFGRQTPPLPLIRAALALKATRVGQLLDGVCRRFQSASSERNEWAGMTMFLGSQVRADDPGMGKTRDYSARNLSDIIRFGRRAGAAIVVSTVAVNMKDCAPFASEHRAGLSGAEREKWDHFYQSGVQAQEAGKHQAAVDDFRAAARSDDTFADLLFRQGQCALALGDAEEARRQFTAARDLDTLRFRCDSQLNGLIRQAASNRAGERILLADAERAFAARSPDQLAGMEFFYEHVHLNFEGNYLLARTIGEQVEKLLPERISSRPAGTSWPTEAQCARRLGWNDYSRLQAVRDIMRRLSDPPFSQQSNHEAQMQSLARLAQELAPAAEPAGIRDAERICQQARAAAPGDPELDYQLALLEARSGDLPAAAAALERELDAVPSDAGGWGNLGLFLSQQQKYDQAISAFWRALALDPLDASLRQKIARSLWKSGRPQQAMRQYRLALATQPNAAVAWMELGQVLEESGRKAEGDDCFRRALASSSRTVPDLVALAHFCQSRSWFQAASTNYLQAIRLEPSEVKLRVDAGGNFALWGRDAEAAEQFRQALLLEPDLVKTRLNLAVALMRLKRGAEALAELEIVLRQDPANALALQYAAQLRQKGTTAGAAH